MNYFMITTSIFCFYAVSNRRYTFMEFLARINYPCVVYQ